MSSTDYQRIEQAILFLERNFHLSDYHFRRLFRRWAGISPKRFPGVGGGAPGRRRAPRTPAGGHQLSS